MSDHDDFKVTVFLLVLVLVCMIGLIVAGIYAFRASMWTIMSPSINFQGVDVSGKLRTAQNYFNWASNVDLIGLAIVIVMLLILPIFLKAKWHHISVILVIVLVILLILAIVGAVLALLGYFEVRNLNNGSSSQSAYSGVFSAIVGIILFAMIVFVLIMILLGKVFRRLLGDEYESPRSNIPELQTVNDSTFDFSDVGEGIEEGGRQLAKDINDNLSIDSDITNPFTDQPENYEQE